MEPRPDIAQSASAHRSEIVDLAARLVAVPTENPPGRAYGRVRDLLCSELERLGLPAEVFEIAAEGASPRYVITSAVGKGAHRRPIKTLYLHGHYDVVRAQSGAQFTPVVEDGRIEGRGAADMKGAIAAMIYALRMLAERESGLGGRVELVLVPDEETGGELGSGAFAESGRLGKDGIGAIIGEPTGGVVWNGSRGALTVRVRLRGRPAHVGLEHEGINAFEAAAPIVKALLELKGEVGRRRTDLRIEPDQARRSILMLGGEVSGGSAFNVVPEEFGFSVERRFNPEEDLAEERQRLLSAIRGHCPDGVELTVDKIQEGDASVTDEDSGPARALAESIREVTGVRPRFELCPGLLETRFYHALGVPAVAYGPGRLAVSHGPNEYVEIERLVECAAIYAMTALRIFCPGH